MGALIDLTGAKFERLTVIKRVANDKDNRAVWLCKCECGKEKSVRGKDLRRGQVKSCGCWSKEKRIEARRKHGSSETRLYSIWSDMKKRCYNENSSSYKNYGARGIKLCDEWVANFDLFEKWSLKNGYEDELTIDRIDNNEDYKPSNCRWVTRKVQCNNRRNTVYVNIYGEDLTISEVAEKYKVSKSTVKGRYYKGIRGSALIAGLQKNE